VLIFDQTNTKTVASLKMHTEAEMNFRKWKLTAAADSSVGWHLPLIIVFISAPLKTLFWCQFEKAIMLCRRVFNFSFKTGLVRM